MFRRYRLSLENNSKLIVKIIFPEGNLMEHTDVLVIGGGVIGVAFAASLESTG